MTDEPTPQGRISRLLARLRRAEPVRPTWRHFAPHAVLAVGLGALQFFYVTLRNSVLPSLSALDLALLFVLPLIFIPVSLLHALWRWHQSRSWRGGVWLLRPALLGVAVLVLLSPLMHWGMAWDFERRLSERNEAVHLILTASPESLPGSAAKLSALPEGYRHLSSGGKVLVAGAYEATTITFFTSAADYVYSTGESKWRTPAYGWYDGHWYLSLL